MSSTTKKINEDLLEKTKSKDRLAVGTLRMVKAAIKEKEIELRRDLKEEEVLSLLRSQIKSRQESQKQFQAGGRTDLVKKESQEIEIIKQYLPPELDEKELEKLAKAAIDEAGAKTKADLGKVMPLAIKKAQGKTSGEAIKNMVAKLLS